MSVYMRCGVFIPRRFLFASVGMPDGGREWKYHPQRQSPPRQSTIEWRRKRHNEKGIIYGLSAALLLASLTACGTPQASHPSEPPPTLSAVQTEALPVEPSKTVSAPIDEQTTPVEVAPQETTILIEPDPIVEETAAESTEPNIDNVPNEHISVFAGVYAIYDQPPFNDYGYPPKITIDETGRVSGQMLSGKTPIYVTENDNGTLICMISEGEEKFDEVFGLMSIEPREFYVICPVGVTSGFEDYPDYDELVGIDSVRIRYIVLDGGAIDVMYHKIG